MMTKAKIVLLFPDARQKLSLVDDERGVMITAVIKVIRAPLIFVAAFYFFFVVLSLLAPIFLTHSTQVKPDRHVLAQLQFFLFSLSSLVLLLLLLDADGYAPDAEQPSGVC